jgi:sulfate adenylyltransferase
MRMGGPREAVWHAIIQRNFGCSHFIVGRDHAGPGNDGAGRPFYGAYDAQKLVGECAAEIGIEIIPCQEFVYVPSLDVYLPVNEIEDGVETHSISGTELRDRLGKGEDIPSWFSYPEVIEELHRAYPPRRDQGFTLFFTGLSGAGKSAIADALLPVLAEYGRSVTLLDGDDVRALLSSELGYSREHRDLNIKRIAFVAQEVTRHRGVAVCAPIAPYGRVRDHARETIGEVGGFLEIYLSTPLEVCEQRDPKGLYARARAGLIKGFTGIDDPYEPPDSPEIEIDTSRVSIDEAVGIIVERLRGSGYLP